MASAPVRLFEPKDCLSMAGEDFVLEFSSMRGSLCPVGSESLSCGFDFVRSVQCLCPVGSISSVQSLCPVGKR